MEQKIISDEYGAGQRVPSIKKLAELYGIGTSTAQKILESLCADNVIIKTKGVGYFVKPFVKDRLFHVHYEEMLTDFLAAVDRAKRLGVDQEKMIDALLSEYNKV